VELDQQKCQSKLGPPYNAAHLFTVWVTTTRWQPNFVCISYPSLFVMLIYCTYKSNVLRVSSFTGITLHGIISSVTIHMSFCVTHELLPSNFYKYSDLKIYEMNLRDLENINTYVTCQFFVFWTVTVLFIISLIWT
jgi:hypothetical protein